MAAVAGAPRAVSFGGASVLGSSVGSALPLLLQAQVIFPIDAGCCSLLTRCASKHCRLSGGVVIPISEVTDGANKDLPALPHEQLRTWTFHCTDLWV